MKSTKMQYFVDSRSRILCGLAIFMGLSSSVLFYFDHRLNQAGIGSPLGLGDTITGTVSIWLQPWLILLSLAGFPFWSIHFITHLVVGLLSGSILAWITLLLNRRWKSLFWPITILLGVLAVSCSFYSFLDRKILEDRSRFIHHAP
jgi:hypothetical protein